jgi:hypothetical protein
LWFGDHCSLLSLLLCLDVPSAPPIAILNSAMDLGGGATARHDGGRRHQRQLRRHLRAATGGLRHREQDQGISKEEAEVIVDRICR